MNLGVATATVSDNFLLLQAALLPSAFISKSRFVQLSMVVLVSVLSPNNYVMNYPFINKI